MVRKLLSLAVTLSMVLSLVPTPAIAEMADELDATLGGEAEQNELVLGEGDLVLEEEPSGSLNEQDASDDAATEDSAVADPEATQEEPSSEVDDESEDAGQTAQSTEVPEEPEETVEEAPVQPDEATDELEAQAPAEDPFYLVDYATRERVTTLHTSGTYELVKSDGTPYTSPQGYLRFKYVGVDPRGTDSTYWVDTKTIYADEEGEVISHIYLENLMGGDGWQLPSGTYQLYLGWGGDDEHLSQTYKVVSDGLFMANFDFSYGSDSENQHEFSVKPFAEGTTDLQYDGGSGEGGVIVAPTVDEQEPFELASDTRLKFWISSAVSFSENVKPQLESIALWKADEPLETLTSGKYEDVDWRFPSRVPEILAEADLDAQLTWPNELNFSDDSELTMLWERGDYDLGERAVLSEWELQNGQDLFDGYFIVDHANFANVVAEDGLYYPIATVTIAGETYTYAYFPIEVSAEATAGRVDPRIVTTSLPNAYVGDEYTATLEARTGALQAGTFSWAVTDGQLPEGLALDSATGIISGTPTTVGEQSFTITLTETIEGEARTATRDFVLRVRAAISPETAFDQLSLGEISYTHGPVWTSGRYGVDTYTQLRIPISIDIRDERYDLGETELWYMLKIQTSYEENPCYYVWHNRAADIISEDGTTLVVNAPLEKGLLTDPKALLRIRAFLIPKTNDGELAFPYELADTGTYSDGTPYQILPVYVTLAEKYGKEPADTVYYDDGTSLESQSYRYMNDDGYTTGGWYGDFAHYVNMPEMPYTAVESPDITIGSWVSFPAIKFTGDSADWATNSGRIRLWAYDGTTTPTAQQVKTIEVNPYEPGEYGYATAGSAVFKLAPGTYTFVAEGAVPVYDENGLDTGEMAWVDITSKAPGARALSDTYPKQYVFTVEPNAGTSDSPVAMDVTYTDDNIEDATNTHYLEALFEQEDGSYSTENWADPSKQWVNYDTAWYRRVGEGTAEERDVLVATGDYVVFGPSDYPLYVEVTPTGSDASFWKSSGKVKVSDKNKSVTIKVDRKQLFRGTFVISCESGKEPAADEAWGIIEVQTPIAGGRGYTTSTTWANTNIVTVPNLTSGSIVTFSPNTTLEADSVDYTVPDDCEGYFTASLVAPTAKGTITFDDLRFVDVEGDTSAIAFDDGATEVKVERLGIDGYNDQYAVDVPFFVADGGRLILQPERYYGNYYLTHDNTTYRVTLTHRDVDAPERLGANAADYAAQQTFEFTLSADKTSETVAATTLTSRGYAVVPFSNPTAKACTLLLYNAEGDLVDRGAAGMASELRTPFLPAGDYTLYAVDASLVSNERLYRNVDQLVARLAEETEGGDYSDRGTSVTFDVTDGAANRLVNELEFPSWQAEDLIDHENSTVRATASYTSNVSITMHAELAANVRLSNDAYFEVITNQASNNYGQGYMNPKALTVNGQPITLNRWENLFNQTQCMGDGSLTIMLSEVAKRDPMAQAGFAPRLGFPMDLTLVIPRTDMSYTEASVWLVSDGGKTRSLVGTSREDTVEASLIAPATVAWDRFYVYGDTGPYANVTIYLNGMQVTTAQADAYGYYTAQITLPDGVMDYSEFKLQASARWGTSDGGGRSASSEPQTVMYTTTLPVVERITMCYQSSSGEDQYQNVTTYYRGMMPDKYLTLYRSEHDNDTGDDNHAKYFWMVEFANGDEVSDVTVDVPRSTSTVNLATTDVLRTAESWIEDVKLDAQYGSPNTAKSATGQLVRDALQGNATHAFVTRPTYFSSSPDTIEVGFDFKGDLNFTLSMASCVDLGRFVGYQDEAITHDELVDFVDYMGSYGNVRTISAADAANLGLGSNVQWSSFDTSAQAQALKNASPGCVDEWLLLGSAGPATADPTDNSLLKVHHQVTTTDLSAAEIQSEVQAVLADAHRVIDPYESWLYDDGALPTGDLTVYKGHDLADAVGVRTTLDESYLYYIGTVDDDGNVQVETMKTYNVESSDAFVYKLTRADGASMSITSWDEKNGQRVEVIYTIASDQVDAVVGFKDLWSEWALIMYAVVDGTVQGDAAVTAQMTGQADGDVTMTAQGPVGTVGSMAGGTVRDTGIAFSIKKALGIENFDLTNIAQGRAAVDETNFNNLEKLTEKGNLGGAKAKVAVQTATVGVENMGVDIAVAEVSGVSCMKTLGDVGKVAVGAAASPATQGFQEWLTGQLEDICNGISGKETPRIYEWYWREKWKEERGQFSNLWFFRHIANKKLTNKMHRRFMRTEKDYLKKNSKQNKVTHDPSGIVYEAVLSNPVEGATVKLYTYNPAAAAAGMDAAQFVDSSQFGIEENPQTTGADGRYQWFVPEGFWQVQVSKRGYENFSTGDWGHQEEWPTYDSNYEPVVDGSGNPVMETVWVGDYGIGATKDFDGDGVDDAESYWMPVLPIQLDVNIGLVSYDAPEIASVEADRTGVTVTFSKYLKAEGVTADLFTINGAAPATFEAVDAELAGNGSGEVLARTFRLGYAEALTVGDHDLSVGFANGAGTAVSYAGVAAENSTSIDCTVHVEPINIKNATVATIASKAYTGSAYKPTPKVTYQGETLVNGTDYTLSYKNNTKAGTATLTLTGIGNFTGSKAVNYTISKASLSKATVTVKAQTYTGKALKPAPVVKVGTRTLKSGTDYTLAYKNNTKVGTATVTVKGKGNYTGSKSATFKITKPSVAKATVSKVANQKYDGTAKKPSPTVKVGGKTLKKGTDYTLTYKNNVKAGTATITIKGKGAYTGSKSVTFKIVAMSGTWKGSGSKWWYQWKDGKYPKSVFLDISGKTYYFDASGYCVYGWQKIGGKDYYFESSGAMAKSKWVGNYYLKADGTMARNEWVDGGKYHVDKNGKYDKKR